MHTRPATTITRDQFAELLHELADDLTTQHDLRPDIVATLTALRLRNLARDVHRVR